MAVFALNVHVDAFHQLLVVRRRVRAKRLRRTPPVVVRVSPSRSTANPRRSRSTSEHVANGRAVVQALKSTRDAKSSADLFTLSDLATDDSLPCRSNNPEVVLSSPGVGDRGYRGLRLTERSLVGRQTFARAS